MNPTAAGPPPWPFVRLTNGEASTAVCDESPAGCMPSAADANAALTAREAKHRVVMPDPNIRRGFVRDEAACCAGPAGMKVQADRVKVSDEDLDWPVPTGDDLTTDLRWCHTSLAARVDRRFGPTRGDSSAGFDKIALRRLGAARGRVGMRRICPP